MGLRALVVEDERLPRIELCALLAQEGVHVVATAASVAEAVDRIREHEPDLLFLDIQLGRESGFDLLERVRGSFGVIFVTAYDQHAVRAFEVNALDYLLKPVDPARLRSALTRLANDEERDGVARGTRLDAGDRIFVRASDRWRFVKIDEIRAIEAGGDYTTLRMQRGDDLVIGKPLREWEERLPSQSFARIHRSTIVNLGFVTKVEAWFNRAHLVHVDGIAKPYTMSRRYASRLRR